MCNFVFLSLSFFFGVLLMLFYKNKQELETFKAL